MEAELIEYTNVDRFLADKKELTEKGEEELTVDKKFFKFSSFETRPTANPTWRICQTSSRAAELCWLRS